MQVKTSYYVKAATVTTGLSLVMVIVQSHQGESCLGGRAPMGDLEESMMMTL